MCFLQQVDRKEKEKLEMKDFALKDPVDFYIRFRMRSMSLCTQRPDDRDVTHHSREKDR